MTAPRRQSSHHLAWSVSNAARSRRPCVAVSSPGFRHLRKNNKRALQCARCLTTLKTAGSNITHAHIPSPPLASKAQIPQRCGRDDTKETGISRQHPAARRRNGANRKTCLNNTVTSRQYGRRAIYVSGDVRFQDVDAFDLAKLGGGGGRRFLFIFSALFQCLHLR